MFEILRKEQLNENTFLMEIKAELAARNILPGQFVIIMTEEKGERIPLTISAFNRKKGSITIVFQAIGASTIKLSRLEAGDAVAHLVGPLGKATELEGISSACVIGGGVGCAIALPEAKRLHDRGRYVDIIAGFRSKDIVMLENEMKASSDRLIMCTDDGTYGEKGFVTDALKRELESGRKYDCVIAIGPIVMMRAVSELTRSDGIRTIVSLNPIMIDGTGMCGCCRVTVDGKTMFACVDGPDFDAHKVDFNELLIRNGMYREQEAEAKDHVCRLYGGGNDA